MSEHEELAALIAARNGAERPSGRKLHSPDGLLWDRFGELADEVNKALEEASRRGSFGAEVFTNVHEEVAQTLARELRREGWTVGVYRVGEPVSGRVPLHLVIRRATDHG